MKLLRLSLLLFLTISTVSSSGSNLNAGTTTSTTVTTTTTTTTTTSTNNAAPITTTSSSTCTSDARSSTCDSTAQTKVGHSVASPNLRIILIRHGESENNVHYEVSREQYFAHRQADPDLTANGRLQAHETAQYLKSRRNALLRNVDNIYVSPLRRTLQTAQPIAAALNLDPKVRTDICEVGGVYLEGVGVGGMTRGQMAKEFPKYVVPEEVTDEGWYMLDAKETKEQGKERIETLYKHLRLQAMHEGAEDRTIALVVHGDFIDYLLQAAFGVTGVQRRFPCWNACISVLDIDGKGEPMVLMHNSVSHLSIVKTESLAKC